MMPISAETKRHKRQNGFSAPYRWCHDRLEQHRYDGPHSHTDLRQQAAALLGYLLAGVIVRAAEPAGAVCGAGEWLPSENVLFDAGYVTSSTMYCASGPDLPVAYLMVGMRCLMMLQRRVPLQSIIATPISASGGSPSLNHDRLPAGEASRFYRR